MANINWTEIIKFIIIIILKGTSKADAVKKAAAKFGVSESDIWKRGGF